MKPYFASLTKALMVLMVFYVSVGCSDKDLKPADTLDGEYEDR